MHVQIMEHINNFSRQRGRVIEFRELLYGYMRVNSLYGQDLIMDLLLVYKKYRGKKMTVPVRRHLYIQRSFTDIRVREITGQVVPAYAVTLDSRLPIGSTRPFDNSTGLGNPNDVPLLVTCHSTPLLVDRMRSFLNSGWERLSDTFAISNPSMIEMPKDRIVFIIPLAGRPETFMRFLRNFEQVALQQDLRTDLLVSLYVDPSDSSLLTNLLDQLRSRYPQNRINYLQLQGNFSRGVALDRAIKSPFCKQDDILFFIDVDMIFTQRTLDRIRANVIRNRQVYLPIVFSEYDPHPESLGQMYLESGPKPITTEHLHRSSYDQNFSSPYPVTNANGYFRQFGYGLAGIYKSDILRPDLGGFNTDITGWGLEDVKFLESIIAANLKGSQRLLDVADGRVDPFQDPLRQQQQELVVFRAPDPSLVHIFHPINCDRNLEEAQYKMCLGTKANTLGSFRTLEERFVQDRELLLFGRRARGNR